MVIKYGIAILHRKVSGKLDFGLHHFKEISSREALVKFDYPANDSLFKILMSGNYEF
jgi:hypothetical protein